MSLEEELPKSGLSYDWFKLEGLAERGAGGRLIIAPGVLTRADLDFNWDVVAVAMEYMGARPGVDQLQPEVDLFFQRSPAEGQETGRLRLGFNISEGSVAAYMSYMNDT